MLRGTKTVAWSGPVLSDQPQLVMDRFQTLLPRVMSDIVFFKFNNMIDIFEINIVFLISFKTLFFNE